MEFPSPWDPNYEATRFTLERAKQVVKDIHQAMSAGRALVLRTKIDEEYEAVRVSVLVSPDVEIHKGYLGLDSTTVGGYEVGNLKPYAASE